MALDLRTLKCNQCGSTALQQIGPIHFQCTHCRATTLVDHRPTMQGPAVRPPTPMPVPMPVPEETGDGLLGIESLEGAGCTCNEVGGIGNASGLGAASVFALALGSVIRRRRRA